MTNKEAQIIIGNIPIKPEVLDDCYSIAEYQEAKTMAIEALEQQSCEDCTVIKKLSRKYYVEDAYGYTDENIVSKLNEIIDVVNKLSSITPTRPTARWEGFVDSYKECSRCGKQIKYYYDYKYCPGCGSEMTESEK